MRDEVTTVLAGVRQDVLRSAHALEVALDCMPVGVSWAKVDTQEIVFTNRKFDEMFGYTAQDFRTINEWIDRAYPNPEDRALAGQKWGEYFMRPDRYEFPVEPIEICVRCKSGEIKTVIVSGVILPETGWALATFVDISERKRNEVLLQVVERQALGNQAIYKLILDHSPEMMILSPLNMEGRYVSPAVEMLTGFTAEEYLALKDLDFMHPEDRPQARIIIERLREGTLSHTLRYRTVQKGGGHRWVEATITGYQEPGEDHVGGYVATLRDLTEQKEREDQLEAENLQLSSAALKDELTGIANRRGFNQVLHRESLRQTRSKHDLSLLLLDVDCFKQYNDLYGHLAGDACLKSIAQVVNQLLGRESDLVARFGGEEFVALLPMTDLVGAQVLANKIMDSVTALKIPHHGSPHGVVTVSVGGSTWAAGEPFDSHRLLSEADTALYSAKQRGRNAVCMAGSMRRLPGDASVSHIVRAERRTLTDSVD
ncbi:MAG: sensor domain-containing diguanylate cyclase [Janthinobacterium lividum]